ncbi:uncharacterized protein LOC18438688 isoform X2 [Amborella trichopoda]|uniref:uncharacterized protein LOC18438688 isoform X2 n=1 Tax=Amborella trichopoda TaxID=13333 RepID=UPI0009BD4829|nr:uncharacterized protein LOC18438688 isoform X2 [Amborella trichopoda]|eukprot:XP_020525786.1 uncharacterized protein LOC18438688 isoform X2 [Amborella trichopoda]
MENRSNPFEPEVIDAIFKLVWTRKARERGKKEETKEGMEPEICVLNGHSRLHGPLAGMPWPVHRLAWTVVVGKDLGPSFFFASLKFSPWLSHNLNLSTV